MRGIIGFLSCVLVAWGVDKAMGAEPHPLWPKAVAIGKSDTGHILFTRHEVVDLRTAGVAPVPVPRIFIMNGDGTGQAPFICPQGPLGLTEARQGTWSSDGSAVYFTSNYEMARSFLFTDVFRLDLATGAVVRVTGNEWSAGPVKGRGTIYGVVQIGATDANPNLVNIAVQGMGGQTFRLKDQRMDSRGQAYPGQYTFVIEGVPAGKVWVKAWASRHVGCQRFVDVAADAQTLVDTMHLNEGNWLATNPSATPDGRFLAVLSQHPYYVKEVPLAKPGEPKGVREQGFDTLAIVDTKMSGGWCSFLWEPIKFRGEGAKDPKISPDGKWIAFTYGQMPAESIAVCTLESMVKGKPDVKVVAKGQQALGVGSVAFGHPAWSADGKRLAFFRSESDLQGNVMGNLVVMNLDGSGAGMITRVAPNQLACSPSFSPDGRRVACSLVTSKSPRLNVLDLMLLNFTCDVWSVNVDGSDPRQLTKDGRSSEPCWGK